MELKLMFLTNDETIAKIAELSGVDWIFVDLEKKGKIERQGHLNTVISNHQITDVAKIKRVLTKAQLLVRVNPIYFGSKNEIDHVIRDGAQIVMLPYFKTANEVATFIKYVNGRAKVCLLLETADSVQNLDSILQIRGIDYIHIGLNDLHLDYRKKFMFELLADGTVEDICHKLREKGLIYGFGGIARLGFGVLRAEYILSEHYRLGSSMTILSRSFYNVNSNVDIENLIDSFEQGVREIRLFESQLNSKPEEYFIKNKETVISIVKDIVTTKI